MNDEQNCKQAFDDFYHKIKAEVSYDHWCAIWRFISKRQARGVPVGYVSSQGVLCNFPIGMPANLFQTEAELLQEYPKAIPMPVYASPQPQQQTSDTAIPSPAFGPIKIGNLPTMNQDSYPGLGSWWVQLRIGPDSEEVLARVYGDTPQQARERAVLLVKHHPQQIPEPCTDSRHHERYIAGWNACRAAMLEAAPEVKP